MPGREAGWVRDDQARLFSTGWVWKACAHTTLKRLPIDDENTG